MKVTIITVVINSFNQISGCIESVLMQDYADIEYIVIDGGSADGTISVIQSFGNRVTQFIVENDLGIYDALNKGISLSTGDLIGILHADDLFADQFVISEIVACFQLNKCDAVYGNLNYVSRLNTSKITRIWRSKQHTERGLKYGWMPAHPTLYVKREVFVFVKSYSLNFGTSSDYELMLRLFYIYKIKAVFLNRLIVLMRNGGVSNGNLKKRYFALINDYRALHFNGLPYPLLIVFLKRIRKLNQIFNGLL